MQWACSVHAVRMHMHMHVHIHVHTHMHMHVACLPRSSAHSAMSSCRVGSCAAEASSRAREKQSAATCKGE